MASKRYGWVWVLPALILFFTFSFWPILRVVYLSFFEVNAFYQSTPVGLTNYKTIFTESRFLTTLKTTMLFVVLGAPPVIFFSLAIASVAHRLSKTFQSAIRFVYYMPVLVTGAIISMVWMWLFAQNGPINGLLNINVQWLGSYPAGFFACLIVLFTSLVGDAILIFIATMNGFDPTLYEASALDGCTQFQQFRYITLPLIWPIAGMMLLIRIIGVAQIWQIPWMMTGGGPYYRTSTLVLTIFQDGIMASKYGLASAESVILMVIIAALIILQKQIERRLT